MLADLRIAWQLASAALDPDRPLIANLVITRRCNLACGYCHEYDKISPPVPTAVLKERIDHLARLRAVFVTLTGGESLLHPEADELVRYVRERGMTPMLNTNGYLLTTAWIDRLNAAGLFAMQMSHRQRHAERHVEEVAQGADAEAAPARGAREVPRPHQLRARVEPARRGGRGRARRDRRLASTSRPRSCATAMARSSPCPPRPAPRTTTIRGLGRRAPRYLQDDFQRVLADTGTTTWKCRAGARTFHVCEDGLVHLCAPRTGVGATPLADYGVDDIRRAFDAPKPCASSCPIAYAHHASRLDGFRPQAGMPVQIEPLVQLRVAR